MLAASGEASAFADTWCSALSCGRRCGPRAFSTVPTTVPLTRGNKNRGVTKKELESSQDTNILGCITNTGVGVRQRNCHDYYFIFIWIDQIMIPKEILHVRSR